MVLCYVMVGCVDGVDNVCIVLICVIGMLIVVFVVLIVVWVVIGVVKYSL